MAEQMARNFWAGTPAHEHTLSSTSMQHIWVWKTPVGSYMALNAGMPAGTTHGFYAWVEWANGPPAGHHTDSVSPEPLSCKKKLHSIDFLVKV